MAGEYLLIYRYPGRGLIIPAVEIVGLRRAAHQDPKERKLHHQKDPQIQLVPLEELVEAYQMAGWSLYGRN